MMNAVGNDFGIGFGREGVAQAFQMGAQSFVILDDPVVHDRDTVAREMRVGVVRGRNAMSGPSSMRNADVAADRSRVERLLENFHFADGPEAGDSAGVEHGDALGIVAAVFQAAQSLHEDGNRVALCNDTHDSTHLQSAPAGKRLLSVPESDRKSRAGTEIYCKAIDTIG